MSITGTAEKVVLALRGEFVPFAVNLAATEASATVQPFMPLAERLGRMFTAVAGGTVDTLEISYEGQIADYDCRVLTLSVLKGVLGPVVDEPVSFVNAPQLAEERGLRVRERIARSLARSARDGTCAGGRARGRAFLVRTCKRCTGCPQRRGYLAENFFFVALTRARAKLAENSRVPPRSIVDSSGRRA
jgi:hypothetical protein